MLKFWATYSVSTPMFLGGAKQQAEFRLPSFKGALRFWWRTLAWSEYGCDLSVVREEEAKLFGSTGSGQSRIQMSLEAIEHLQSFDARLKPGLTYLAGMGLCKPDGILAREALAAGLRFKIKMGLTSKLEAKELALLRSSLILTGLLGGLGSRNRHGFGSISLEQLSGLGKDWLFPSTLKQLEEELNSILRINALKNCSDPPYSAISTMSRFILIEGSARTTAERLLEQLGNEMIRYRSYGRKANAGGRINSLRERAEQNFENDHHSIYDYVFNGKAPVSAPERSVFGLPHNYYFQAPHHNRRARMKAIVEPSNCERRASPLFIHIHRSDEGSPFGIVSFLPSEFLPPGESIQIKNTSSGVSQRVYSATGLSLIVNQWKPVHNYLDRLKTLANCNKVFEAVQEVRK